jgi:hypothetical protein
MYGILGRVGPGGFRGLAMATHCFATATHVFAAATFFFATGGPEASSTHLGHLPQPTTKLDYDLGTAGNSEQTDNKWT